MNRPPSDNDDVIDSRSIIERIEELTEFKDALDTAREALTEAKDALTTAQTEANDNTDDEQADALAQAFDAANDAVSDAESAVGLAEVDFGDDEAEELRVLEALQEEGEGYSDWRHGATLVRDSHFEQYAREFADEIGAIPKGATWPCTCIDWTQAAEELQQDYSSVEFGDVTYWIR
jgi:hypothetical protein